MAKRPNRDRATPARAQPRPQDINASLQQLVGDVRNWGQQLTGQPMFNPYVDDNAIGTRTHEGLRTGAGAVNPYTGMVPEFPERPPGAPPATPMSTNPYVSTQQQLAATDPMQFVGSFNQGAAALSGLGSAVGYNPYMGPSWYNNPQGPDGRFFFQNTPEAQLAGGGNFPQSQWSFDIPFTGAPVGAPGKGPIVNREDNWWDRDPQYSGSVAGGDTGWIFQPGSLRELAEPVTVHPYTGQQITPEQWASLSADDQLHLTRMRAFQREEEERLRG